MSTHFPTRIHALCPANITLPHGILLQATPRRYRHQGGHHLQSSRQCWNCQTKRHLQRWMARQLQHKIPNHRIWFPCHHDSEGLRSVLRCLHGLWPFGDYVGRTMSWPTAWSRRRRRPRQACQPPELELELEVRLPARIA